MVTAKEVAIKAREIIDQFGWSQGTGWGKNGERCIGTAVSQAMPNDKWLNNKNEYEKLTTLIAVEIGVELNLDLPRTSWIYMIAWNDHPDRTKQDVLDVLDRVIAKA